jgi:hypothetical protein
MTSDGRCLGFYPILQKSSEAFPLEALVIFVLSVRKYIDLISETISFAELLDSGGLRNLPSKVDKFRF